LRVAFIQTSMQIRMKTKMQSRNMRHPMHPPPLLSALDKGVW